MTEDSVPTLGELTPELYDRLLGIERRWADWAYRARLSQLSPSAPGSVRQAVQRAYTQAALLWMLIAVPFALAGAMIVGARTGSIALNLIGGGCLLVVVGCGAVMFVRGGQANVFFRQLDEPSGDDPDEEH